MQTRIFCAVALSIIVSTMPAWAKEKTAPTQPPMPQNQPATPNQGMMAAGQWGCNFSYAELNPQGRQTSGFNREFVLALYPNGGFEAQGSETGVGGYSQFYSQGQWQETPGPQGAMVSAQGPLQSNDPYAIPGMIFGFNGQLQGNGTMNFTYEQPDPYQQYVMNRTIYMCQRQN